MICMRSLAETSGKLGIDFKRKNIKSVLCFYERIFEIFSADVIISWDYLFKMSFFSHYITTANKPSIRNEINHPKHLRCRLHHRCHSARHHQTRSGPIRRHYIHHQERNLILYRCIRAYKVPQEEVDRGGKNGLTTSPSRLEDHSQTLACN